MLVPKPPVKLEGHCSVIYDNTLYTYSTNGFASIPLERNGTWSKLKMGEPVSGAACVTAGKDSSGEALYVIGGTSDKGDDGPGVQRYSFKDKKWKSLDNSQTTMANRTNHKAVYLKSSDSILVYGGHMNGASDASSDTFALNVTEPYDVASFSGENASPAFHPVLVPWSDKDAALVGGVTATKKIHLFNPAEGWHSSDVTIDKELSDNVQCALIKGSDGSKVLESFDMSVSPNTVSTTTLVKASGKNTRSIRGASTSRSKRDITLDGYPKYDDSLASSTKRDDYSLAQGDNQMVVLSSGSGTDSLAIFNQTSNSWVNSTKLFYGDESPQKIIGTTTTSSTPTATATESSATTTGASAPSGGGSSNTNLGTVVGATLGSILGVAAILILILFCIKRKKDSQKQNGQAKDGDKDRLSFQDRGVEPLTRSAYPMAKSPAPLAASSVDSLAIFSGEMSDEKSPRPAGTRPLKPSPLNMTHYSGEITAVNSPDSLDKSMEAKETLAGGGGHPGDRRTNEGWSMYFEDNSATDLAPIHPPPKPAHIKSEARTSAWPMATLTPLDTSMPLEAPRPLGRVVTGSPTTEHTSSPRHIAIPESQSARISTASSISMMSDDEPSGGMRESYWPTGEETGSGRLNPQQQSWMGRPPSSTYSRSYSQYNPSTRDLASAPPTAPPSMNELRPFDPSRTNTRGSSILIPETVEPLPTNDRNNDRTNINSDMSWLNLNGR